MIKELPPGMLDKLTSNRPPADPTTTKPASRQPRTAGMPSILLMIRKELEKRTAQLELAAQNRPAREESKKKKERD